MDWKTLILVLAFASVFVVGQTTRRTSGPNTIATCSAPANSPYHCEEKVRDVRHSIGDKLSCLCKLNCREIKIECQKSGSWNISDDQKVDSNYCEAKEFNNTVGNLLISFQNQRYVFSCVRGYRLYDGEATFICYNGDKKKVPSCIASENEPTDVSVATVLPESMDNDTTATTPSAYVVHGNKPESMVPHAITSSLSLDGGPNEATGSTSRSDMNENNPSTESSEELNNIDVMTVSTPTNTIPPVVEVSGDDDSTHPVTSSPVIKEIEKSDTSNTDTTMVSQAMSSTISPVPVTMHKENREPGSMVPQSSVTSSPVTQKPEKPDIITDATTVAKPNENNWPISTTNPSSTSTSIESKKDNENSDAPLIIILVIVVIIMTNIFVYNVWKRMSNRRSKNLQDSKINDKPTFYTKDLEMQEGGNEIEEKVAFIAPNSTKKSSRAMSCIVNNPDSIRASATKNRLDTGKSLSCSAMDNAVFENPNSEFENKNNITTNKLHVIAIIENQESMIDSPVNSQRSSKIDEKPAETIDDVESEYTESPRNIENSVPKIEESDTLNPPNSENSAPKIEEPDTLNPPNSENSVPKIEEPDTLNPPNGNPVEKSSPEESNETKNSLRTSLGVNIEIKRPVSLIIETPEFQNPEDLVVTDVIPPENITKSSEINDQELKETEVKADLDSAAKQTVE